MFPSKTLVSLIFAALSTVDASPLSRHTGKTTLGFATHINERGIFNVAEKDRARAKALKQGAGQLGKRNQASFDITNGMVSYTTSVGVGSPPTDYTLLIDTGSSNTWVGAGKAYVKTSTSHDTGNAISMTYGSGSFSGEEWTDTVTLSPDLVIRQQSIGVASASNGFQGIDGILGVGPLDLTKGTVNNTSTFPTVSDNLFSQGTISEEVLGVYFVPASETVSTGELTFGGYDSSKITQDINYVPLTENTPAAYYWGIDQSISYGSDTILSTTSGVVDTGTTFILIASDAFQAYQSKTGGVMDSNTGLLSITLDQYNNLQPLTFHVGGTSYDLSPNGQIWPRSLNNAIGGSSTAIYLIVSDIGVVSGVGFDFVNGYTFLERFYSVFDTTNKRVGFATTPFTDSNSN